MLSLKRFGMVISNNFNRYKQDHGCALTQTHTNTRLEIQESKSFSICKKLHSFIARSSLSDHRYLKDRVVFGYYLVPKGL